MAGEPRLSFSAKGSGVVLHTKYGQLNFNAEEYGYYQSLFKLADSKNIGKLIIESPQLVRLLIRTEIEWIVVQSAIKVVQVDEDLEQPAVNLNQWLILCKLLACYQTMKKVPSEKVFKQLHKTALRIPLAEFNMSKAMSIFHVGEYYKVYICEVTGWDHYGEEYENHHVKFKISTTSSLINRCTDKGVPTSLQATEDRVVVERRYSDFESFAHIMHRNYKGVVVPPLPPKNWTFPMSTTLADSTALLNQRQNELQLFLNDVVSHPVLRHCYELTAFLESSTAGFKCFLELYSHIQPDGRVVYSGADGHPVSSSSGVSKLISEGANVMSGAGQAVAQSQAFGYLSTLWGAVSKTVFSGGRTAQTHTESPEESLLFKHTTRFLEMVLAAGQKLEHLVALEVANCSELAKLGQCFKNMSESEPMPGLVRVLQLAHEGLVDLTRSQTGYLDRAASRAQGPVTYAGRYLQAYQSAVLQRAAAITSLQAAQRREAESKKAADMLAASASSAPPQQPLSSSPSSTTFNEELLNHAKLDLAAAEDGFEAAKEAEAAVTAHLKSECKRLQNTQTKRILDHLVVLARINAERCHASVLHWETMRDMMYSDGGGRVGNGYSSGSSSSSNSSSGAKTDMEFKSSVAAADVTDVADERLPVEELLADLPISAPPLLGEAPPAVPVTVGAGKSGKKKKNNKTQQQQQQQQQQQSSADQP